jgi:hypothetical protein
MIKTINFLTKLQLNIDSSSLDSFPAPSVLDKFESLYSIQISEIDLYGTQISEQEISVDTNEYLVEVIKTEEMNTLTVQDIIESDTTENKELNDITDGDQSIDSRRSSGSDSQASWKSISTVDFRPNFFDKSYDKQVESYIQVQINKKIVDPLAENRKLRRKAEKVAKERIEERKRLLNETLEKVFGEHAPQMKVHMYSQQKFNYKTIVLEEIRKKLTQKNVTLTYNKQFNSSTIANASPNQSTLSIIDPPDPNHKINWLTEEGFQYPKPRTRQDLIRHPNRPSETRIEGLKQPWEDPANSLRRKLGNSNDVDPHLVEREKGFRTNFHSLDSFGLSNPIQFEHDIDFSALGKKNTLPRGVVTKGDKNDRNDDFFRSVHLAGDELIRVCREAALKEKEEWIRKVVVYHLDFKVGGFKVKDKPVFVDKYSDILKDEADTNALKHLRSMKSHKGNNWGYDTTPATILSTEPFIDNLQSPHRSSRSLNKRNLRKSSDIDRILPSIDSNKQTDVSEFKLFINPNTFETPLVRMIAKKKHPPLDPQTDRVGPKWDY